MAGSQKCTIVICRLASDDLLQVLRDTHVISQAFSCVLEESLGARLWLTIKINFCQDLLWLDEFLLMSDINTVSIDLPPLCEYHLI